MSKEVWYHTYVYKTENNQQRVIASGLTHFTPAQEEAYYDTKNPQGAPHYSELNYIQRPNKRVRENGYDEADYVTETVSNKYKSRIVESIPPCVRASLPNKKKKREREEVNGGGNKHQKLQ